METNNPPIGPPVCPPDPGEQGVEGGRRTRFPFPALDRLFRPPARWSSLGVYADLVKDTFVYTTAGTLVRSVSLLVVPVLTRRLSLDLFGVLEAITAAQLLAVTLSTLCLDAALIRYFYEAKTDRDRRACVSTIGAVTLLASCLAAAAIAAGAADLSVWLFGSTRYARAVTLSGASVPFTVAGNLAMVVLRLERRTLIFGALSLAAAVIYGVTVTFAAFLFPNNVDAVVLGQLTGQVALAALTVPAIRRCLGVTIDRAVLRRTLRFALPYYPSILISWYTVSANRFFLVTLSSLGAAAAYGAASKLHTIVLALSQAFLNAWKPYAMARLNHPDGRRITQTVMKATVLILSLGTVAVGLVARPLLSLYAGPQYAQGAMTGALLVLSTCLTLGFTSYFVLRLEALERTGWVSGAQLVTLASCTVLNLLLIPWLHHEGAALAVVGSGLLNALVLSRVVWRLDGFRVPAWLWTGPAGAGGVLCLLRLTGWL